MRYAGRRRHIQDSIHDFVSLPIIWQGGIVTVGPLSLSGAWNPICRSHYCQSIACCCHISPAFRFEGKRSIASSSKDIYAAGMHLHGYTTKVSYFWLSANALDYFKGMGPPYYAFSVNLMLHVAIMMRQGL